MNTFPEIVNYLYQFLPYYQNQGVKAYRPGLSKMFELCEALGNPHIGQTFIHVAGTNGKGSVSHMLTSILMEANINVGLYSSPHLFDLRERFKINGELIEEQTVIDFVNENKGLIEQLKPSFFELTVAMAFVFFKHSKTDVNIIEVGLGGRLDSTNVIDSALSVITNIELEHTHILGDTIEAIANEKAGIIKPQGHVVLGNMKPEAIEVITEMANLQRASYYHSANIFQMGEELFIENGLKLSGELVATKERLSLELPTLARYQIENAQTAIAAISTFNQIQGEIVINSDQIRGGLRSFQKRTNFRGRFEVLGASPLVIADAMHNPAGARQTIGQLADMGRLIHAVLGFSSDKDVDQMLKLFPTNTIYYFCRPNSLRAKSLEDLQTCLINNKRKGFCFEHTQEASLAARYVAKSDDIILIGGSIFLLAELI